MPENEENKYCLFSNVSKSDVDWLWYPFIPCGKITILQGDPGGGKSTLMLDLIGKLTTGRALPDGRKLEPINVIYQCSEDGLADTIKPRLEKANADCNRVGYINEEINGLSLDDEIIRDTIIELNARLLVIDPIQAYVGDADLSNASGMRKVLRRLSMWASATNCAIVLIGHLNKRSGSKELYRGLGSIDLVAAARSVIQVERDEDNDEIGIIKHIKSSLASKGKDQSFCIDEQGCLNWVSDAPVEKIQTLFEEEPKSKQERAAKAIQQILANGPVETVVVENMLLEKGIGLRTINSAKRLIAVESQRKNKKWYWCLPTENGLYPTITEAEQKNTPGG